jgi:hypothetical protein
LNGAAHDLGTESGRLVEDRVPDLPPYGCLSGAIAPNATDTRAGYGKGTQAKLLCERFKMYHLSTGEIFRPA